MIKWTFHFEEGNVATQIKSEEEDNNLSEQVSVAGGIVHLPGEKLDIYVNMERVRCVTREIIDEPQVFIESPSSSNPESIPDLHPQSGKM